MKRIFKYPFSIGPIIDVEMPLGAKILDVQMQDETPVIWALVEDANEKGLRRFRVLGTGHSAEGLTADRHIGTFQMAGGALVWHLFE